MGAFQVLLLHGSADPVSGMVDLANLMNQLQEAGVEQQNKNLVVPERRGFWEAGVEHSAE